MQSEVGGNTNHTVLTVSYVAHRGNDAWQVYDINQPGADALLSHPGVNVNALRPYKGFSFIQEEESVVNSTYNSLQVLWERRFTGLVTNSSSPKYFSVNATAPPSGTFNLAQGVRDSVYQPGFQDWNLSLFKTFAVNERMGFQFRAEAYDFPNHPNLCSISQSGCSVGGLLTPTSSQFGMITSKSPLQRTLQVSLRFYF